ncbi:ketoacyl-ACP synthase III [Clostridium sp. MSJ-11]|uniref:Ketoacyl-ACP synthase III n=1 Tax=Clostridium mobile TaxID=2841512 RepID=A0ABS6EGM2_9CLOT|nr:3-oxoacyl-[acyl-carrier-protein] synthase III C-terminal domain-containing protein [Clostridium mobile]MBU5484183.1 ketoacyl-ACP synthase III [Clostridium mobile]
MSIKIKNIEYYHPKTKYSNEYFVKHFFNQDVDISGLLNITGRNQRYISEDFHENSLTMAIEACKKVIRTANIDVQDINLVVFVSTSPEYLSPTNAVKIHDALGLAKDAGAYDMNGNCAGMIIAMDQVCRTMKSNNRIKYSLLVGSDLLNRYSRRSEAITYANFGESACAVLLENTDDNISDFIDSSSYVDSSLSCYINFPPEGFSKVLPIDEDTPKDNRIVEWIDFNTDDAFASSVDSINEILLRNNLTKDDVKLYCLSQFAKKNVDMIMETLEEPEHKFPFVGDRFGYTGVTSPFMALADSVSNGKLNRGDYIILWTVGAGVVASCILLRY